MMKYKDCVGHVIYDGEAKIFHGEVMGLRDVITFLSSPSSYAGATADRSASSGCRQGSTVKELEKAFKDSIDDYLAFCKERGEKPEKTFSGNLRIRIDPNLHAQLALEASTHSKSLNTLIIDKLRK
jgi:predicted HicB family RNase H-like nuclease